MGRHGPPGPQMEHYRRRGAVRGGKRTVRGRGTPPRYAIRARYSSVDYMWRKVRGFLDRTPSTRCEVLLTMGAEGQELSVWAENEGERHVGGKLSCLQPICTYRVPPWSAISECKCIATIDVLNKPRELQCCTMRIAHRGSESGGLPHNNFGHDEWQRKIM